MTTFVEITALLNDYDAPLKIIAAVAAPGGIWFWIDKFRNRIRVKVRRLAFAVGDTSLRGLTFEAENISPTVTSFEPEFTVVGYTPMRKKLAYTFTLDGADRQLPSYVSKQFIGWHPPTGNDILAFLWFMTIRLPLSRGRVVRIRVLNAELETMGFFRFYWQRLLWVRFGRLPKSAL